jgi:hypothetical protein
LLIVVRGSLVVFADISHRLYSVLLGKGFEPNAFGLASCWTTWLQRQKQFGQSL